MLFDSCPFFKGPRYLLHCSCKIDRCALLTAHTNVQTAVERIWSLKTMKVFLVEFDWKSWHRYFITQANSKWHKSTLNIEFYLFYIINTTRHTLINFQDTKINLNVSRLSLSLNSKLTNYYQPFVSLIFFFLGFSSWNALLSSENW